MEALKSPVIVANIDDVDEPEFQGKYNRSIVIDRYGRKIGVIGIIISTVDVRICNLSYLSLNIYLTRNVRL